MKDQFIPGQYVKVRDNEHQPWQVRIFHSFDTHRPGSWDSKQYARVMLKDGFQFNKDAATECFMMIEPWVPEAGQWVLYCLGTVDDYTEWQVMKITPDWYSIPDVHPYIYGGAVAPLTLPPFIAPGDKY